MTGSQRKSLYILWDYKQPHRSYYVMHFICLHNDGTCKEV